MARDFDGVDDHIDMANNATINALTNISFAGWVMRQGALSASGSRVVEIGNGTANDVRVQAVSADNKLNFIIFATADNTTLATTALTQDVWYHFAATYDGTTRRIYVNGTDENNSTTVSGNLSFTASDDLIIGNRRTGGTNRAWNGLIAELGVWNRGLSASEVASLNKGFSPLFYPRGLDLYFPLIGNNSPETDIAGGFSGTVTGATKGTHPRIIYPSSGMTGNLGTPTPKGRLHPLYLRAIAG